MADEEETTGNGIEIIAKLMKLVPDKHLVKRKLVDGTKVDDFEIVYTMKLGMKRQKLDKLENVVEGTSDPWITISISSLDENQFKDFATMQMGDEVLINITPM